MKKRVTALLLAICLVCGCFSVSVRAVDELPLTRKALCVFLAEAFGLTAKGKKGNNFTDVTSTMPEYDAIMACYENNLLTGTGNNNFSPDAYMTRAMVATVLCNAASCATAEPKIIPEDLEQGTWYRSYCLTALSKGFLLIAEDNLFYPNSVAYLSDIQAEALKVSIPLTRAQMCQIVADTFHLTHGPITEPFTDVPLDLPEYDAIYACAENGIVVGNGIGGFMPSALVTRGQAAQLLCRAAGFDVEEELREKYNAGTAQTAAALFGAEDGFLSFEADKIDPSGVNFSYLAEYITLGDIHTSVLEKYVPQPLVDGGGMPEISAQAGSYYDFEIRPGPEGERIDDNYEVTLPSSLGKVSYLGNETFRWQVANVPGAQGVLYARAEDGSRYSIPLRIAFPSLGVYTEPQAAEEYYLGYAKDSEATPLLPYRKDAERRTLYVVWSEEESDVAFTGVDVINGTDKVDAQVLANGRAIAVTVKPGVTGEMEVQINPVWARSASDTGVYQLWLWLDDDDKLYVNGTNDTLNQQSDTAIPYTVSLRPHGDAITDQDGFVFNTIENGSGSLGKVLIGPNLLWNTWISAKPGATGKIVASKKGFEYSIDVRVGVPYFAFYKAPEATLKNLFSDIKNCVADFSKSKKLKTLYLCSYYEQSFTEAISDNEDVSAEITQDGKAIKVSLKEGVDVAKAHITVSDEWNTDHAYVTFMDGQRLMTGEDIIVLTGDAGSVTEDLYLRAVDNNKYIDETYRVDTVGPIGVVEWMDTGLRWDRSSAVPGTEGKITASKNGVTYSIPVSIGYPEIGLYSSQAAVGEHCVGSTVNLVKDPALKTMYLVLSPDLTDDTISDVQLRQDGQGYVRAEIGTDGKSVRLTRGETALIGNKEISLAYTLHHEDGTEEEKTFQFTYTDGTTLEKIGYSCFAGRVNTFKLVRWDGAAIDDTYTVSVQSEDGSEAGSVSWANSTTICWDAREVKPSMETVTFNATKGDFAGQVAVTVELPFVCAFSEPISAVRAKIGEKFLGGGDVRISYADGRRKAYLANFTEDGAFQKLTALSSSNEKIRASLAEDDKMICVDLVDAVQEGTVFSEVRFTNEEGDVIRCFITFVDDGPVTAGSCGEELTWEMDTDSGKIIIQGEGEMSGDTALTAWDEVKEQITAVEIGEGATSVGSGAFQGCTNLENVTLPESVESIGDGAFSDCEKLESVYVPESVTNIAPNAFEGLREEFAISGRGNTYAETFAMERDIPYQAASESADSGEALLDVGKIVTVPGRVAISAVLNNEESVPITGDMVAAIYYKGKLISCSMLPEEVAQEKLKTRRIFHLPCAEDLDPEEINIQLLYLDPATTGPKAESARASSEDAVRA